MNWVQFYADGYKRPGKECRFNLMTLGSIVNMLVYGTWDGDVQGQGGGGDKWAELNFFILFMGLCSVVSCSWHPKCSTKFWPVWVSHIQYTVFYSSHWQKSFGGKGMVAQFSARPI